MKEIKTCEEYVLNELEEKKAKEQAYKNLQRTYILEMARIDEFLDVLQNVIKMRRSADGKRVIDMKLVFEQYEPEEFKILEDMLELKVEGEE